MKEKVNDGHKITVKIQLRTLIRTNRPYFLLRAGTASIIINQFLVGIRGHRSALTVPFQSLQYERQMLIADNPKLAERGNIIGRSRAF